MSWPNLKGLVTLILELVCGNCGSYHPTGTIPLGALSAGGCLDGNFYLHGSENLQILSTAIFPTGGGANPTMMLIQWVLNALTIMYDVFVIMKSNLALDASIGLLGGQHYTRQSDFFTS